MRRDRLMKKRDPQSRDHSCSEDCFVHWERSRKFASTDYADSHRFRNFEENLWRMKIIGLVGFEPTASWSRTRRSTKLSHSPFTYENRAEPDRREYCLHTDFLHCSLERMSTLQSKNGAFQKVGECLYRYSSNGVYYARIRVEGKEIKRSLQTTDRAIANRELAHFKNEQRQIDRSQGKLTLAELCERYLKTIEHQKPK